MYSWLMEDTAATQTQAAPPIRSAAPPAKRRDRNIAAVCSLFLLIGMPIGWLTDNPSTGDVVGLIALSAFTLGLMAWLIAWLLPRERAAAPDRANRTL